MVSRALAVNVVIYHHLHSEHSYSPAFGGERNPSSLQLPPSLTTSGSFRIAVMDARIACCTKHRHFQESTVQEGKKGLGH